MRDSYLLGIDCGLTFIKAVVFTLDGCKKREARRVTPIQNGFIDAETLWQHTCECIRESCSGLSIIACGLSGHGNGLYALDTHGTVITARSSMAGFVPHVADEDRFFSLAQQSYWAGQPMQLLRCIKETDSDCYQAISSVLLCKDYLRFRLTGILASDYSDASAAALLDAHNSCYSDELCALTGVSEKVHAFAPLLNGYEIAGRISKEAASLCGLPVGTPVAAGFFDANACMLGAGVVNSNRYSVTAGTWGVSALPTDRIISSHEITQNCHFCDREHHMAIVSAPTSCVNLEWFLHNVHPGLTYDQANEIAAAYAPDEVQILYLPYLHADMRYPELQAGFHNLRPESDWKQMLRAVYEGVMFAHRLQIERLTRAGLHANTARLSGGAVNGSLWTSLFADGMNLTFEIPQEDQVGALGAAMAAAVSIQLYPNLNTAVHAMTSVSRSQAPEHPGAYDEKYHKFLRLLGEEK